MIILDSNGHYVQFNTIVCSVTVTKLSFIVEVFIA